MWQWPIDNTPLTPTGYGICGGEIYVTEGYSGSRSSSGVVAQIIAQPELYSPTSSTAVVGLWLGTRGGYSASRTSSSLDMARGLTIMNKDNVVSLHTNVVTFDGEFIGTVGTFNRNSQASVFAPPDADIDGGEAEEDRDVLDGGDADG